MNCFDFDSCNYNNDSARALLHALDCCYEAAKTGCINRIVIILPIQHAIENIVSILLGNGYRKANGTICKIGYNTNIVITSVKSYNHFDTDAVVFFGLDSFMMFEVEEKGCNVLEIAVNDYSGYELWKGTWEAKNPDTGISTKLEPNDKIKNAFDQLSRAINITNTFAFHPSDEELVKKFIRTLNSLEPNPVNADEVFAYLRREKHWTLGLCKLVREWINRLNNGGTFKGGTATKTEMKALYAKW